MAVRKANVADVPAMVDIVRACSDEGDSHMDFRYPYRLQYPEDERELTTFGLSRDVVSPDYEWLVYEIPSTEPSGGHRVVAFCSWHLPGKNMDPPKLTSPQDASSENNNSSNKPKMRHAHLGRREAYSTACYEAHRKLIFDRYGDRQFSLEVLACHPSYQRKGASTKLCEWGLRKAKTENLVLSVCSTEKGLPFYKHLGFQEVGSFRTQVENEDEYLDAPILTLKPDDIKLPSS